MKDKQEIKERIKYLEKSFRDNEKEEEAELKRGHPMSAQVHTELGCQLKGQIFALEWVLDKE